MRSNVQFADGNPTYALVPASATTRLSAPALKLLTQMVVASQGRSAKFVPTGEKAEYTLELINKGYVSHSSKHGWRFNF